MILVSELREWANSIPPNEYVCIDEGGLTLELAYYPHVYLEVGGLREEDLDEPKEIVTEYQEEADDERRLEETGD